MIRNPVIKGILVTIFVVIANVLAAVTGLIIIEPATVRAATITLLSSAGLLDIFLGFIYIFFFRSTPKSRMKDKQLREFQDLVNIQQQHYRLGPSSVQQHHRAPITEAQPSKKRDLIIIDEDIIQPTVDGDLLIGGKDSAFSTEELLVMLAELRKSKESTAQAPMPKPAQKPAPKQSVSPVRPDSRPVEEINSSPQEFKPLNRIQQIYRTQTQSPMAQEFKQFAELRNETEPHQATHLLNLMNMVEETEKEEEGFRQIRTASFPRLTRKAE